MSLTVHNLSENVFLQIFEMHLNNAILNNYNTEINICEVHFAMGNILHKHANAFNSTIK